MRNIPTRTFVYGPGIDEPVRMSIMPKMDVNGDGSSTMDDVIAMSNTWLLHEVDANFDDRADLNHDGVVNNIDADILAGNWKVIQQNAARYYYHFDGLGSVTAISEKDGQTVEAYQYSVFGDTAVYNAQGTRLAASAVGNVYFFTARRLDTETGIYYYRARMYAPHLGRFLQTDPIGYSDGINWYLYCSNNPNILVDPYGFCGESSSALDHRYEEYRVRPGSDLYKNLEEVRKYKSSFAEVYPVKINRKQEQEFLKIVNQKHDFNQYFIFPTYNCTSWASDTFADVTGIRIDPDGFLGFETPGELADNIKKMNNR